MLPTKAYAAFDSKSPLRPFAFERRDPRSRDVVIAIDFCGVCHSDLHQVRDEWNGSKYPMVPGHEIVGHVVAIGAEVTKHVVGDRVGVGCFVDSCRECEMCKSGQEQFCAKGMTGTYNSTERDGSAPTQGGYSSQIVVDESYVLRVPKTLPLDRVAPLLCAGITTYSPLRHWKVAKGHRVGILGLGGLGHMGVKLAVAMGAEVTLLSSSPSKKEDARRLGAHEFIVTKDAAALAAVQGRFDLILDSVSAPHDLAQFVGLLRPEGTLVLLGAPSEPYVLPAFALIMGRRSIAGSLIGGIRETQEMLNFCAEREVAADVETIPIQEIDRAYDRMLKGDVRYRFVIDAKSLTKG
jgi:alcohol dehydrogenase (NADP+)